MKLKYFLFSDSVGRTADGKTILHGIFDSVLLNPGLALTPEKPSIIPSVALSFEVADYDPVPDGKMKIVVVHKTSGRTVVEIQGTYQAPDPTKKGINGIQVINGFPIIGHGIYSATLFLDGKEIATTELSAVPRKG